MLRRHKQVAQADVCCTKDISFHDIFMGRYMSKETVLKTTFQSRGSARWMPASC
jgi:hypothetical protein